MSTRERTAKAAGAERWRALPSMNCRGGPESKPCSLLFFAEVFVKSWLLRRVSLRGSAALFVSALVAASAACAVGGGDAPARSQGPVGRAALPLSTQVKDACSFKYAAATAPTLGVISPFASKGFAGSSTSTLVADVDGDGYGDIVQITAGDAVTTFLGAGDGTFGAGIVSPVPVAAGQLIIGLQGLTVGDFDGDGLFDVALLSTTANPASTSQYTGRFVMMFGAAGGVLDGHSQSTYAMTGGNGSVWHLAGDFDGDGKDDFYFANFGTKYLMFGNGTRALNAPVTAWPSAATGGGVVLAPKTGPSSLVLVSTSTTSKRTYGAGRAPVVVDKATPTFAGSPLVGGDLDGDGVIDVAAAGATLDIATPGNAAAMSKFVTAGRVTTRAMVDLDGDDKQELVYASATGELFAACGYEPGGTELAVRTLGITVPTTATLLSTKDLNGDGRPDFVTRTSAGAVAAYLSGPQPAPSAAAPLTVLTTAPTLPDAGAPVDSGTNPGTDAGKPSPKDGGTSSSGASGESEDASTDPGVTPGDGPVTTTTTTGCALAPHENPAGGLFALGLVLGAGLLAAKRRRDRR